ncbi:MAG: nicotinamide-nucleotide amidohydrolase family protein [Anaerolineaceae bacterium]|nr:nicotinamide-nucleotide amidohydrolase family protein [Anaerolineaceae bacterium]
MRNELKLVFGTSADPLHQGHVELVVDAVRALTARSWKVAEVILMPVFRHHNIQEGVKRSLTLTFEHRYTICQLAADEIRQKLNGMVEKVSVSDLERELVWQSNRPNFTAETMEAMRKRTDPNLELAFLIGADSFTGERPGFAQWHRWEELIKDAMLVISPRKGFIPNQSFIESLTERGGRVIYLEEIEVSDISSRIIRTRLETGTDPSTLAAEGILDPEIAEYIANNDLVTIWKQIDTKQPVQVITDKILENDDPPTRIGKRLFEKKLSLGLAESCTGGLIGHLLTNVPGASEYFMGSIVAYAYQAKVKLLGVSWDTLQKNGAVSSATVLEMAQGARRAFNTDVGLSVSCIAGPGGATTDKPVGTSWCGLSTPDGDWSYHFQLEGNREEIKSQLAHLALAKLGDYLQK